MYFPSRICFALLAVISSMAVSQPAAACPGDEWAVLGKGRPSEHDILIGKFSRHSPAFYRWLIIDIERQLEADPKELSLYDDLAFAYARIGKAGAAQMVMSRKSEVRAQHYKTERLLAGILMEAGKYDQALAHAEKAISINPNELFAEAGYRKYVLEYLAMREIQNGRSARPLKTLERRQRDPGAFYEFFKKQVRQIAQGEEARQLGLDALKKMLRCGGVNSPILLELYGDLLLDANPKTVSSPRALAARAYLRAANQSDGLWSKEQYRLLAEKALEGVRGVTFSSFKRLFARELKEGRRYYSSFKKGESAWLKKR